MYTEQVVDYSSTESEQMSIPSFGVLLQESWDLLVQKIKPLVIVTLLPLAAVILLSLIIIFLTATVLTPFGLGGLGKVISSGKVSPDLLAILPGVITALLGASFIFLAVIVVLSILMQVASIKIIDEEITFKNAVRSSFKYIPRMVLAAILIGLIVGGGLFLFVIPGIVLAFYLIFVPYEIILGNQRVTDAIRNSITLVKSHAQDIFSKMLFLFIVTALINYSFKILLLSGSATPALIVNLVGYLVGLFSMTYIFKLYQSVKASAAQLNPAPSPAKLRWFLLVSLLGWIMFTFFFWTIGEDIYKMGAPNLDLPIAQEHDGGALEESIELLDTISILG